MRYRPLLPLALLTALCASGCDTSDRAGKADFRQDSASFPFEFTLTDVTGKTISLADYRGKVVIVDIWGTWCPPCRLEVPSFIKLQETYGSQGFQMIGVNYEEGNDQTARKTVTDFISEYGINYPCALGTAEVRAQVPNFGGFPTTIFVDKSGQVRAMLVGLHQYEALEKIVKALLAE